MYLAIRDTRISLFLISYVYRRHEGTQAHGEYKTIRRLRKEKKRYTNQHTMSIFCVPSDKKNPLISRAFVSHWQGQRPSEEKNLWSAELLCRIGKARGQAKKKNLWSPEPLGGIAKARDRGLALFQATKNPLISRAFVSHWRQSTGIPVRIPVAATAQQCSNIRPDAIAKIPIEAESTTSPIERTYLDPSPLPLSENHSNVDEPASDDEEWPTVVVAKSLDHRLPSHSRQKRYSSLAMESLSSVHCQLRLPREKPFVLSGCWPCQSSSIESNSSWPDVLCYCTNDKRERLVFSDSTNWSEKWNEQSISAILMMDVENVTWLVLKGHRNLWS